MRRRALVTGSGRGLGRHLAVALGSDGFKVVVHYRSNKDDADETARLVAEVGGEAELVSADLSNADEVGVMAEAVGVGGPLDVLVNNVGGFIIRHTDELSPQDWDRVLAATASATFYTTHALLPLLRGRPHARIINIADSGADNLRASPKSLPYYVGKTGVLIMTKTFAVTEADRGVTVNAVMPGVLENSITFPALEKIPAGRLGSFGDIAGAVRYLVSPEADYVTGSYLQVGGGWNL
ncbi:MAG: SDR family oxidoreductase [Acidimicrobiia bacterium]|nr:SDR family oxidoreductase [Acidimicrobiia bacterium]